MTEHPLEPMPDPPPEPLLVTEVPHGSVLAFVPHPDDEIAGPGGALCLHHLAADPVEVVVATDGKAGDPEGRYDAASYPQRRREESRRGLAELGVEEIEFWGFPDSCQLSAQDIELGVQHAVASLHRVKPSIVYLPWEHEAHPDHHALYHIVVRAMQRVDYSGLALGYEIWNAMLPDFVLEISPVMDRKMKAMSRYESQLAYARFDHCVQGLNAYRSLAHGRGKGYWEAYRIVQGQLPRS